MCFSVEASFAVGGAVAAVGGYCLVQAVRKQPRMWGLALVPLLFGVHQVSEGFVWLGLTGADPELTRTASLVYLFFAVAFWPFWFPMFAAIMEKQPRIRWVLAGLSLLATGWFWGLYYPILAGPPGSLRTIIVHHSVQYELELSIYDYAPKPLMRVLYLVSLAVPFVLSSEKMSWLPGVMLGLSAVVCFVLFSYAFVSVWCFFAAIMSGYIGWIFFKLPVHPIR